MSNYIEGSEENDFTIKDTELLLRLINMSSIPGTDIIQCVQTMKKLEKKHKTLINKVIGI